MFLVFSLGQTVLVCQWYNGGLWSPPQRACTEKLFEKLHWVIKNTSEETCFCCCWKNSERDRCCCCCCLWSGDRQSRRPSSGAHVETNGRWGVYG